MVGVSFGGKKVEFWKDVLYLDDDRMIEERWRMKRKDDVVET